MRPARTTLRRVSPPATVNVAPGGGRMPGPPPPARARRAGEEEAPRPDHRPDGRHRHVEEAEVPRDSNADFVPHGRGGRHGRRTRGGVLEAMLEGVRGA